MTEQSRGEELRHRVLLADVARAYYLDNRSKVDIAAAFGVSRFQVARLLEEARDQAIVRIEIRDPRRPRDEEERVLARRLGVEEVRIVEDPTDDPRHRERVGAAVLGLLQDLVRSGTTVGLSWSRTLDDAASHLTSLPPSTVVQLTGAVESEGGGTFTRLLSQLNQRDGVSTFPIYAPLVVDAAATAEDLRRQPIVAAALDRANRLDLAVVAVGAWRSGESSVWDRVGDDVHEACSAAGVVAEMSGLFLDAEGRQVETPLTGRTIGVSLAQLRGATRTIGFAHGAERAEALVAAARSGVFETFVVDAPLAGAVLGDAG